MYFYKGFSKSANITLECARKIAQNMGHLQVGSEHILLAILQNDKGNASTFLIEKHVFVKDVKQKIYEYCSVGNKTHLSPNDFSSKLMHILDFSAIGARSAQSSKVEPEHILAAMLNDNTAQGTIILKKLGLETEIAAKECQRLSGQIVPTYLNSTKPSSTKASSKVTDKYGRDLTRAAIEDSIDPVFERDAELERLIQILCRRQKNNPCLVGEPGVGKTAVVEGLARKIAQGNVPLALRGKRVVSLDMASLVAGTKYRGDFEERFKGVLEEVMRDKVTIVFIDEIHSVVGAGAAEGAIDASGILKPPLARGELQLIGATTLDEYRKCIEKDSALERRFAKIEIEEPSIQASEKIIRGLKSRYEQYHGVKITESAITGAVALSKRYLPERYLPDKAIDLIDEACALVKTKQGDERKSVPTLTQENIAVVISRATGIPLQKITQGVNLKLQALEGELSEKVIGQSEAVKNVAEAIVCSRMGLKCAGRPIGVYMFLGPTGVGKTELAKSIAESWFGSSKALIRLDMSEYMEQHSVSRLIGAPPGYIGHESGGQLTQAIRRRPYSVVLFDEIEKAHSDIYNILLQILDEGILTDSSGRKVNFSNTLIILTSNIGAEYLNKNRALMGFAHKSEEKESLKKSAIAKAKTIFRPELIGRIDEIIVFDELGYDAMIKIGERMLVEVEQRSKLQEIILSHSKEALEILVSEALKKDGGARALRRIITKRVEENLAKLVLKGETIGGKAYSLIVDNGKLLIN